MKSHESETVELKEIYTPDLKKKLLPLQIQMVGQSILADRIVEISLVLITMTL
ncbi:hypothetical protein [Anaerotignum sp.]|uniref:hypothetical protein n=1 Tax=Anaerotignum sp. TaxID=2039241 RepID=UPI002899F4C4|nr:hypothetical protein [Anaerotignum sp.]